MQETKEDNDQAFLEKMEQYTRSANGAPEDQISIPIKDLRRLIEMINNAQQSLFTVRQDWIPPFGKSFHD
jgi:hypothetical protein